MLNRLAKRSLNTPKWKVFMWCLIDQGDKIDIYVNRYIQYSHYAKEGTNLGFLLNTKKSSILS